MADNKSTVLVVEDENNISKVIETLLIADGYKVISASSGAEAKSAASAYMPDIILLDLGLPDMDGTELIKVFREWNIPTIVVSARNMETDKVKALDLGADDYISKPFSAPEMLARIRAVLRRNASRQTNEDSYEVGDFRIDFARRTVSIKGEIIKLTQVEYKIVEFIARNPGKVLTYSQIMNHVWGPFAEDETNRILRVNMSNIRHKIEQDSMAPRYILTEIGVGYRMAE